MPQEDKVKMFSLRDCVVGREATDCEKYVELFFVVFIFNGVYIGLF